MANHFNFPGAVPLHQFVSKTGLEALHWVCYLAAFEESPLFDTLQAQMPKDINKAARTEALKEMCLIAQKYKKLAG